MTERNDTDALAAARSLTGALDGMTGQLKALAAYGKRNRRMIWGLVVSITLDLILTAFVAVTAIQAHDANTSAQAARAVASVAAASNRNLCESSNVARAQQIDLWTFVINLGKDRPQTAQQKANTAKFEAHLETLFAPRNCSRINPGNP